jgi:endonuclease/exonuclease/phosphatase family metal-dependent hydrolase
VLRRAYLPIGNRHTIGAGHSVGMTGVMLRVVQLNVDSLVSRRWLERRQEIVTWLDELNPDVVGLQEVWQDDRHPNTGGWIAEYAAGDWQWEFGGFPPPDPKAVGADPSLRFGSAILSRWPFGHVGRATVVRADHRAQHARLSLAPAHATLRRTACESPAR